MKKAFLLAAVVSAIAVPGVLGYSVWKGASQTAQGCFDSGKKYYDQKNIQKRSLSF
jgi:hypothetical protein